MLAPQRYQSERGDGQRQQREHQRRQRRDGGADGGGRGGAVVRRIAVRRGGADGGGVGDGRAAGRARRNVERELECGRRAGGERGDVAAHRRASRAGEGRTGNLRLGYERGAGGEHVGPAHADRIGGAVVADSDVVGDVVSCPGDDRSALRERQVGLGAQRGVHGRTVVAGIRV